MSFQKMGIELMVKGVSQFARNIGFVNTSYIRYTNQLDRTKRSLEHVAQREVVLAQKRIANLQSSGVRHEQHLNRLNQLNQKLAERVANLQVRVTAYFEIMKLSERGSADYSKAQNKVNEYLQKLDKTYEELNSSLEKTQSEEEELKLIQQQLSMAVFDGNQKFTQWMGVMQDTHKPVSRLAEFMDVLTGGFGKNAIAAGGAVGVLAKMAPQAAAVSLALDVLKTALDMVTFAIKATIGILKTIADVIGRVLRVLYDFGKIIVTVAAKVGQFAFDLGKGLLTTLWNVATFPFKMITGGLGGFGDSLKRVAEIAIGMNLDRILWGIGQKVRELGETSLNAASDFQLLTIRLRGLIQREMANSEENIAFSDSLETAARRAEDLSYWISELAIKSIFGGDEIANTFTLAMAYDFTEEQSKELTDSVMNFATGMGLTDQAMSRIIENFGQLRAQGKLNGQELRDLARGAFVPVNRVIEKMNERMSKNGEIVNYTREEWVDMISDGKYGIDEFFWAFIDMVNEDFPNAVENASASFEVVRSNIQDFFKTVIGWRVIKPTLDIVSKRTQSFIENVLMSEGNRAVFEKIGNDLATIFGRVFKLSDLMSGDVGGNLTKLLQKVSDFIWIIKELTMFNKRPFLGMLEDLNVDPKVIDWFDRFFGWLGRNKETIKNALGNPEKFINDVVIPALQTLKRVWNEEIWPEIKRYVVEDVFPEIKKKWDETVGEIVPWIEEKLQTALDGVRQWAIDNTGEDSPLSNLIGLFKAIVDFLAGKALGEDVDTSGIAIEFNELKESVRLLVDEGLQKFSDWIHEKLPWLENLEQAIDDIKLAAFAAKSEFDFFYQSIRNIVDNTTDIVEKLGLISAATSGLALVISALAIDMFLLYVYTKFLLTVVDWFLMNGANIITAFGAIGKAIGVVLTTEYPYKMEEITPILKGIFDSAYDEITTRTGDTVDATSDHIDDLIEEYQRAKDEIVDHSIVPDMMDAIVDVMSDKSDEALENLKQWVDDLIGTMDVETMHTTGYNMLQGLQDGLLVKWNEIKIWWSRDVATWLADKLSDLNQLSSPSRVFMDIGYNMMAGLAEGIRKGMVLPTSNMLSANRVLHSSYSLPSYSSGGSTIINKNYNLGGVQTVSSAGQVIGRFKILELTA